MSVLELIDNIFQLIVTLSVGIVSCIYAIRRPKHLSFQYLAGASICWFVGTSYWSIYFLIYHDFPYYFSASELCYLGLYLFLISLSLFIFKENNNRKANVSKLKSLTFSLPFYVLICNTVPYLMYGGLFWNLYYGIPLFILACISMRNLFITTSKPLSLLNISIICFVFFSNTMFLVSCFGLNNIYILFDFMLSLTLPTMLFFIAKENNV